MIFDPKSRLILAREGSAPAGLSHPYWAKIPGINLGPWGKDLHQLTERVYDQDMLETIPNFLLYLLENTQSFKV